MTWEWSHTTEAYQNAYNNLQQLTVGKLQEIWCEIQTFEQCLSDSGDDVKYQNNEIYSINPDDYWNADIFSTVTDQHDLLVDWIWEWASNWRQCDNGGFNLHLCPYGCHTVSVDNKEVHHGRD